MRRIIAIFAGVIMLSAFAYAVETGYLKNELTKLNLWPKEERLTELYFDDNLPAMTAIQEGSFLTFRFYIRNLEGRQVDYRYRVTMQNGNRPVTTLTETTVTIPDGEKQLIEQKYFFTAASPKVEFFVDLPDFGRSIHFTLPRTI